jgi:hypothetical protein
MSRKGCAQKDPPLTAKRIEEGQRLLRWSRTLEQHKQGYDEWSRKEVRQ